MEKTIIIILFAALTSCSIQRQKDVCNCNQKNEVAKFVSKNIRPSNNMSDEEMEDVIRELKQTGIDLFCEKRPIWYWGNRIDWDKQKLDSCESIML